MLLIKSYCELTADLDACKFPVYELDTVTD